MKNDTKLFNLMDFSIVSQSLFEYNNNSSTMPWFPSALGSNNLPSDLNEVLGVCVSFDDQMESTMWVQPGDLNGLKCLLVKMLELSRGCLPLTRVPFEYQKFFDRPLYVRTRESSFLAYNKTTFPLQSETAICKHKIKIKFHIHQISKDQKLN